MWMSVLLLAIAVNFEPTRLALVPLLLSRENPRRQLIAFLAGSLTLSVSSGLLILFVFHRMPLSFSMPDAGHVQIAVGTLAVVIALIMALRWMNTRSRASAASQDPGSLSGRVRTLLQTGNSPWFAGLVGAGTGLPSLDSLGVFAIIAASQTPPAQQLVALLMFTVIGSLVVLATLTALLLASARALELLNRFGIWIRSRNLLQYAVLLAAVGVLLIVIGFA